MKFLFGLTFNDYHTHLAILISIYIILAQSLNLTFGLGRLFNLAHVASYAIGAYTTALLSTEASSSFFTCVTASMIVSGIFAFSLGAIALRLSTDYFAIGTLAFASVVSALLINWKSLTHGVLGIPGIPRPELLGVDFYDNSNFLDLILLFVITTQLIFYVLSTGSFGRTLRALAEYEQAAATLGKNTRLIRNLAFFFSSSAAGLAGSFFAYYLQYIDPSSFSLAEMVFVLTIVIIGRPGSFLGVIAATVFLLLLPEALRRVEISSAYLGPMRQLLYAVILFGAVWWKRETIFPRQRQV
jgi:branched-chain amino acid transport system permease protein